MFIPHWFAESTIEQRGAEIHVAIFVCQRFPIVP